MKLPFHIFHILQGAILLLIYIIIFAKLVVCFGDSKAKNQILGISGQAIETHKIILLSKIGRHHTVCVSLSFYTYITSETENFASLQILPQVSSNLCLLMALFLFPAYSSSGFLLLFSQPKTGSLCLLFLGCLVSCVS